ncbi:MAG: hypothetical protein WCQ50_05960 [Spirochaetota bacterium]
MRLENVEQQLSVADGCKARCIIAVGGGTRNAAWKQIVSDIAGITRGRAFPQLGAALGDAFLAVIGAGLFSGSKDIERWIGESRRVVPHEGFRPIYDDHYRIYRQLYDRNSGLMHDLARLRPH